MRKFLSIAACALGVALLVMGVRHVSKGSEWHTAAPPPPAGGPTSVQFVRNPVPVPELTVTDLEGRTQSSRAWRGKVTLVNFWATWCRPCREEIPALIELQNKYREWLQIIGVSTDESGPDAVRRFAVEHRITYPIVMATDELRRAFPGVFALPTTFVIDREGRTVQKHIGLIDVGIYEQETRVLSGLAPEVAVERIDDKGQVLLANAALATEIPGLDLSALSAEKRRLALEQLNADRCRCGCELTLAACRINDADCKFSLPEAREVVKKISEGN